MLVPASVVAIVYVSEFERIREFIRGPYVMPGYMYANQVLLKEMPFFAQESVLDSSYWYAQTVEQRDVTSMGAYLFGQECAVCHTVDGINDIKSRSLGTLARRHPGDRAQHEPHGAVYGAVFRHAG